ncbi:MAG TPA: hypothetical protein VF773_12640 [Verrucomicrobiae bacterium]
MRSIVLGLFLALASTSIYAQKEPSMSHLPASVQERIREWKGDGQIKTIKTRKQANGSNHYEVLYKERGDEKSVIFAEDGSVISEGDGKGGNGKAKGKEKQKEKSNNKNKNKNKDNKGDKDGETEVKDDDDNRAVTSPSTGQTAPTPPAATTPQRPTAERPVTRPETATTRPPQPASSESVTRPTTTRPAARPETATAPNNSTLPGGVRWTGSQTRYVYWDNLPEPVRTAAKAQEAQHGSVNTRALRQQTSGANSMYHIPYERASIAYTPNGSVAIPAANTGGPMRQVNWDSVPEAVRKATETVAAAEGGRNTRSVFSQAERGKTLYHIIFEGKNNVIAFSPDGTRQDPASFWK